MSGVLSKPNEAKLRELPLERLPMEGCIIVTGRSGSGKTITIRNLMRMYRKDMDIVVVMCGSMDTCDEYREHIPGSFVHYISKFGKKEKEMLQMWYGKMEELRKSGHSCRMMLIFDDISFLKGGVNNDETVTKILYNGRHAGILFIWAQQYIHNAGPDLRSQTRLTFATYDKVPANQERLFHAFNPCLPPTAAGFRDFVKVYEVCTENYGLMVLDNAHGWSKQIADNVYFFNPEFPVPPFRMMKNSPAWDYDELKQQKDDTFVEQVAPVGGEQGLIVSKLYNKKKTKRKRDYEEDDYKPKRRKSKRKPEVVTIA